MRNRSGVKRGTVTNGAGCEERAESEDPPAPSSGGKDQQASCCDDTPQRFRVLFCPREQSFFTSFPKDFRSFLTELKCDLHKTTSPAQRSSMSLPFVLSQ